MTKEDVRLLIGAIRKVVEDPQPKQFKMGAMLAQCTDSDLEIMMEFYWWFDNPHDPRERMHDPRQPV